MDIFGNDENCLNGIAYYSHEIHCTKYYTCVNGTRILSECGNGLVWNMDKKSCDWPSSINNCLDVNVSFD